MTAIITGEKGEDSITRYGLEEYVADCVILLDHRVTEQISTRRLRVVKYRGSAHGTNEYPFLIGEHGLSVLPITSLRLDHEAPRDVSSRASPGSTTCSAARASFAAAACSFPARPAPERAASAASFRRRRVPPRRTRAALRL